MTINLDELRKLAEAASPGPWRLGEFDKHLGYDCMTGGVRSGPALLDGSDYGQKRCEDMAPEAKARMLADDALIAAASPQTVLALLGRINTLEESADLLAWAEQNSKDMGDYFEVRTGDGVGGLRERIRAAMNRGKEG